VEADAIPLLTAIRNVDGAAPRPGPRPPPRFHCRASASALRLREHEGERAAGRFAGGLQGPIFFFFQGLLPGAGGGGFEEPTDSTNLTPWTRLPHCCPC